MAEPYTGVCTVTEFRDPLTLDAKLWIDQADKHIMITDQLLEVLTERGWAGEGLFRIDAENGSVTYALRDKSSDCPDCWRAERRTPWPLVEAGEDRG